MDESGRVCVVLLCLRFLHIRFSYITLMIDVSCWLHFCCMFYCVHYSFLIIEFQESPKRLAQEVNWCTQLDF